MPIRLNLFAEDQALVRRGEDKHLETRFGSTNVQAPVKAGQPVGTILVLQGGKTVARGKAISADASEVASWWRKLWPF